MSITEPDITVHHGGRMIHYEVPGVAHIIYTPADARVVAAKLLSAADEIDGQGAE